jgi:hypothetical protein
MHRKLPLLGVVLAAGLFSIPAVFPAEHWAVFTDRRQNPLILEAMQSGDLADALETARALGRREDVYVADILSGLLSRRQELPILFLLRAVFPPAESSRILSERLSANTQGLDELAAGLGSAWPAPEVLRLRALRKPAYDGAAPSGAWLGGDRAQVGRGGAGRAGPGGAGLRRIQRPAGLPRCGAPPAGKLPLGPHRAPGRCHSGGTG